MKSRDDSVLYSGLTSASSNRVAESRKLHTKVKDSKRNELQPDAHLVFADIAKERDQIPEKVWELIGAESTEENTKSVLLALRYYERYLVALKNRLSNTLKVKPTKETSND